MATVQEIKEQYTYYEVTVTVKIVNAPASDSYGKSVPVYGSGETTLMKVSLTDREYEKAVQSGINMMKLSLEQL